MQGLARSSSKNTQPSAKHFDGGKYEFIGIVLRWKPHTLPRAIKAAPLSTSYTQVSSYYEAFKLPILEEARAIIASGLEQVDLGKTPKSVVRLRDCKFAKNRNKNPSYLIMEGSLADEENTQAVVVLLKHASGTQLLGITSQDNMADSGNQLRLKVLLDDEALENGAFDDESSARWQLYVLGSIVAQIRMYEVCTGKPVVAFMRDCLTARSSSVPQLYSSTSASNLQTLPTTTHTAPIKSAIHVDNEAESEPGLFTRLFGALAASFMSFFSTSQAQPTTEQPVATISVNDKADLLEGQMQQEKSLATHTLQPQENTAINISEGKADKSQAKLNSSQRKAIHDFVKLKQGLQLLQGPPGTGKTTTIVELLKALCQKNQRILVCAPSNKAVQVLAKRFLETHPDIPMALAGIEKKVPPELRDIFIHTWGKDILKRIATIYADIKHLAKQVPKVQPPQARNLLQKAYDDYRAILAKISHAAPKLYRDELHLFLQASNAYLKELKVSLPAQQHDGKQTDATSPNLETLTDILARLYHTILPADVELLLLNHARVVFATLCVSGRSAMKKMNNVDVLIVDEAAQAVEAETLIAFQHHPQKCLLVGDTKQLPAFVQSEYAKRCYLDWSMMWRLMEQNNYPYHTLTTQYRMHPDIRSWPSYRFYNDKLEDGENINQRRLPALPSVLMPYAFIDIDSYEQEQHYSYSNEKEAAHILRTLKYLRDHHQIDIEQRVGIITGYAGQVALIKKKLQGEGMSKVSVNTVDGYQGDECDFIFISFVRSNRNRTIGFLKDFRRLNVAITRARLSLVMFGNKRTLMSANSDIRLMLQDAEQRQCIFAENVLLQEFKMALQIRQKSAVQPVISAAQSTLIASTAQSAQVSSDNSDAKSVKPPQNNSATNPPTANKMSNKQTIAPKISTDSAGPSQLGSSGKQNKPAKTHATTAKATASTQAAVAEQSNAPAVKPASKMSKTTGKMRYVLVTDEGDSAQAKSIAQQTGKPSPTQQSLRLFGQTAEMGKANTTSDDAFPKHNCAL